MFPTNRALPASSENRLFRSLRLTCVGSADCFFVRLGICVFVCIVLFSCVVVFCCIVLCCLFACLFVGLDWIGLVWFGLTDYLLAWTLCSGLLVVSFCFPFNHKTGGVFQLQKRRATHMGVSFEGTLIW